MELIIAELAEPQALAAEGQELHKLLVIRGLQILAVAVADQAAVLLVLVMRAATAVLA